MKDLIGILIGLLPTILLVIFAGVLALKNKSGWGWFLFVALLIAGSTKIRID